jgi:hypothetical protein
MFNAKTDATRIYIIGTADGPKKIGISVDPMRRRGSLGVDGCQEMNCRYYKDAFSRHMARQIEAEAHRILAEHHVGGEWFGVTVGQAQDAIAAAVSQIAIGDEEMLDDDLKPIIVRGIDAELMERLDREAKRRRVSRAAMVRMLLAEHLPE